MEDYLWRDVPLMSDYRIEKEEIEKKKEILRPYGVRVNLLSFSIYSKENIKSKRCLIYKIPKKNMSDGELYLVNQKRECSTFFKDSDLISKELEIKKLKISIEVINGQYFFKAIVVSKTSKLKIKIPIFNVKQKIKLKRYDFLDKNFTLSGLKIDYKQRNGKKRLFFQGGKTLQSSYLCRKVNSKCKVEKDNCNRCEKKTLSVVGKNCPDGGDRFCTDLECGKLNSPACSRGKETLSIDFKEHCFDGSPLGFCKNGLIPICDKNLKILVCR